MVTAGLICALLPTASATMTPKTTASPQPVVITSQPEFSPWVPLSNTVPLTPLPINIKVIVPMSSPRNALDIVPSGVSYSGLVYR